MSEQCPASASSMELSTTSNTMWCRPVPSSVSPMYIPGRLRTASRPLSTLILVESYALPVLLSSFSSVIIRFAYKKISALCLVIDVDVGMFHVEHLRVLTISHGKVRRKQLQLGATHEKLAFIGTKCQSLHHP